MLSTFFTISGCHITQQTSTHWTERIYINIFQFLFWIMILEKGLNKTIKETSVQKYLCV